MYHKDKALQLAGNRFQGVDCCSRCAVYTYATVDVRNPNFVHYYEVVCMFIPIKGNFTEEHVTVEKHL